MQLKNDFLSALLKEIEWAQGKKEEPIETIYLGGGTPSILKTEELNRIMNQIAHHFNISAGAEITLEANPDDVLEKQARDWLSAGINRLSMGIQSFRDEDLRWMNRSHSADQAKKAIEEIRSAGFENFSIDLIFGTPGLDSVSWERNLDAALNLEIPHLSCYALTVEPRTALDKMILLKKKDAPDPDLQAEQFLLLIDRLHLAGYEHYEISNFALPGMRSRHNTAYWKARKYFGFGPSAHSFDGYARRWNIANNVQYIKAVSEGRIPFDEEKLTQVQQLNEYIMTALRTLEGINLERISKQWNTGFTSELEKMAEPFLMNGKLYRQENRLLLTREGKLFADGIAASLFQDEIDLSHLR
jgi:oxygen-independent coproporphyrinogen III oxidase